MQAWSITEECLGGCEVIKEEEEAETAKPNKCTSAISHQAINFPPIRTLSLNCPFEATLPRMPDVLPP